MLNSTKELRVTEHDSQFLFSETCLVGFLVSCCLFSPSLYNEPSLLFKCFSLFFSTSCLLTRWPWRCQRRSRLLLTCQPKHQPCCQNTHAHTAIICIPSCPHLIPTPLTCCVSVRPLKMFSSTLPPALSRCISIVSIERSGDERRKVANESMTENEWMCLKRGTSVSLSHPHLLPTFFLLS